MQAIIQTGRLVTRALLNGVYGYKTQPENTSQNVKKHGALTSPQVKTALAGFPKDFSIVRHMKGQFGDDASFTAKHKSVEVLGVADGVGGWRQYGVDPGEFAGTLMKTCEKIIHTGRFNPKTPELIISQAYYELSENKSPITGSSTACVMMIDVDTLMLHTANIGDSGFMVFRHGNVVHRSTEQQHYFNTPYQLALPPPGTNNYLSDSPESAVTSDFVVELGDVIICGTDGVFDNLTEADLMSHIATVCSPSIDETSLQKVAHAIALQARAIAFDANYLSPFSKQARKHGIPAMGGKPDDITVLLAAVVQ